MLLRFKDLTTLLTQTGLKAVFASKSDRLQNGSFENILLLYDQK